MGGSVPVCTCVWLGHNARCTELHLFSHKGPPSFGTNTHAHTHTHSCWVVGNFLILVLKFYNQPERKSFKADVRNILYPSEWVVPFKDWVHLYLCVCMCMCFCVFGLRCHCFSITFVQWHQWDWEWEWTNKHTHSLFLTHTYRHTQTHTREATGMLCCIVGEGALSGSRPLHGTLERLNSGVPAREGVVK